MPLTHRQTDLARAVLATFSFALTRGDMLPVILISALFRLAQLSAKSIGQTVLRDAVAISPSQDRSRRFR
jgi:Na+/H+-dicarboxylate symporter